MVSKLPNIFSHKTLSQFLIEIVSNNDMETPDSKHFRLMSQLSKIYIKCEKTVPHQLGQLICHFQNQYFPKY